MKYINKKLKISIVIPVYNAEKYIGKCIESLINQTYENIEIILVNDGSEDNTLNILTEYTRIDDRVIVINQKNSGPSVARNVGIYKSTGDYITFIDSDDYVDLNYIEEMSKLVNEEEADMVVCNYLEIRKEGSVKVQIFNFIRDNEIYYLDEKILGEIISGKGGLIWGKMFKLSLIKDNNLKLNPDVSMCEDLLFCIELTKYINKIIKVDKYLYIHNKCNDSSITSVYNKNLFIEQVEVQKSIEHFMNINGLLNNNIKNLLCERLKSILWFSIYKEIINKLKLKNKLENINNIINHDIVVMNVDNFNKCGPIDRAILKTIKHKNSFLLYILGVIRIELSNIKLKFNQNLKSIKLGE